MPGPCLSTLCMFKNRQAQRSVYTGKKSTSQNRELKFPTKSSVKPFKATD